ncbi:MAG: class I fructose-bisphosphate aldolase [Candidatus Paceibacterota bacterium]
MNKEALIQTARHLVQKGKGILAADESNSTADKRLKAVGVESNEEMRRQYRELLLMTPEIENYISGVILYEETLGQRNFHNELFIDSLERRGIVPGIKVDAGSIPLAGFPDEEVTEGLDELAARVSRYYELGARFAKWRAVIRIGVDTPTPDGVRANAHVLARYSRICQEGGLVPIVEPEVLITGAHSIDRCETVLTETTRILFDELRRYRVELQAVILKSSMVLPGDESGVPMDPKEVAWRTVRALRASVPAEVPGVVFLSGGQTPEEATLNLNEMAHLEPLPFEIAFSYARALQGPALEEWRGLGENWDSAQAVFLKRVQDTVRADLGEYPSF